ncbi:MAG: hypothetical protein WC499_03045 [Patescibacteria group bacterium]
MFDLILWILRILMLVSLVSLVCGFFCLILSLIARNQNISKKTIGWKLIKIAFIAGGIVFFCFSIESFIYDESGEAISYAVSAITSVTIFTEKLSIGNLVGLKMANLLVGRPPYIKE